MHISGFRRFKNTNKIQRKDPRERKKRKLWREEGNKRAKFWAVRRRVVRRGGGFTEGGSSGRVHRQWVQFGVSGSRFSGPTLGRSNGGGTNGGEVQRRGSGFGEKVFGDKKQKQNTRRMKREMRKNKKEVKKSEKVKEKKRKERKKKQSKHHLFDFGQLISAKEKTHGPRLYVCQAPNAFICVSGVAPLQTSNAFICVSPNAFICVSPNAFICVSPNAFICVSPNAFVCVSPNAFAESATEFASLAYLCSLRSHVF